MTAYTSIYIMRMERFYETPQTEVLDLRLEQHIMSFGSPDAPGRGFNGSNTNEYDDAF